jgi:hypothetical protein
MPEGSGSAGRTAAFAAAILLACLAANPVRAQSIGPRHPGKIGEIPAPASDADLGYFSKPQYIGDAYCYACHMDTANDFAKTRMGQSFLIHPRNDLERKGCEGCHGPGSNHAMLGGGLGVGGLIEFHAGPGQSTSEANRACLNCHQDTFWHEHTHGAELLPCSDCHIVMTKMSPTAQLRPPYVTPWNHARGWGGAALAGLFAGVLTGAIFRRRKRTANG